jgi:hypothetical protein
MLYLGHFSFVEHDEGGFSHGVFATVVTADDIDSATVKFHTLLDQTQNDTDLFDKRTFIFLENIIEIKQMPEEGFITHHSRYEGEPPASVSRSLCGISEELCESYRPYPEFEAGEVTDDVDIVPFMTIER